jgi:carbon monoxide dehydrogenase subunit G
MTQIVRAVHIKAPKHKVWEALADFGNVSRLSPGIKHSHLTSAGTVGLGSTRHCDLSVMGATLDERIAGWEEGASIDIDIYRWTNLPLMRKMGAHFRIEEDQQGNTCLIATLKYVTGMGLIGWFMDTFMMKPMNGKNWAVFVAGIRHYVETGQAVKSDTKLNLNDVVVA